MENKVTIFNPIGEYDKIYKIQELIYNIENAIKVSGINVDVESIKEEFDKRIKKWKDDYAEIVKYFSNFWGKYIHIRFLYNSNFKEDRESNPNWTCDYEVNGLVYQFIPINDSLFGVFNRLNDSYDSSFKDNSIDLAHYVQTHRMEVNEITEEDFLNQAQEGNFNVLKNRLDKIESGEYELNENGYFYPLSEVKINWIDDLPLPVLASNFLVDKDKK